jgi:diguanylate cyclase (GGDEF)-like protein
MSWAAIPSPARTPTDQAAEEAAARKPLRGYALAVVLVAVVVVVLITLRYPLTPTIALRAAWVAADWRVPAGIAFWIAFGLFGSFRARGLPGGAVLTFHMPFVVAGTVLGGPLVGAWMGVVSEFEVREVRRVPWYGLLGNHAIVAISAILGGLLGQGAGLLAGSVVPAGSALDTLIMAFAVAAGFSVANIVLVLPVVALRGGIDLRAAMRSYDASIRATVVAEAVLAWLMVVTYLEVAWWAPLACVGVILVVWEAHDRRERALHDELTGLINPAGLEPRLAEALYGARHQGRRHALVMIDLDDFGILNKVHGADVGDEVIVAVAQRMKRGVRATDAVARQNRAGDEFTILFTNVPSEEVALALAQRIRAQICEPIRVRGSVIEVQVGASMGLAMIEPGWTGELAGLQMLADRRMQYAKRNRLGIVAQEPEAGAA